MPENKAYSELSAYAEQTIKDVQQAASERDLEQIRVASLGKKGHVTALLKLIGTLNADERPEAGKKITAVRKRIEAEIQDKRQYLKDLEETRNQAAQRIDVTLPARQTALGGPHPLTRSLDRMHEIFARLGFEVAVGPEIEIDYYNFEALNFPANHPARAMQDTFYFADDTLLRTHTSPVQIRYMKKNKPPIRVVAPGRVYRCDSDMTHTPMFHQLEGLVVDETTSFADLKGMLEYFVREFFEADLNLRFRPSYFPFTEPSAEVDISCVFCGGSGCNVCKQSGWLEVLGCGMVHPVLYQHVDIDVEQYTGYAFGLGIERFTMLRYGVNDLRLFFKNDIDMLNQFK